MNKPRILLCNDDPYIGGVAQHSHMLLTGLSQYRWWALQTPPPENLLDEQMDCAVGQIPLGYDPVNEFSRSLTDARRFLAALQQAQPHLVIFNDCCPVSHLAAKAECRRRQVPYVVVTHFASSELADRFCEYAEDMKSACDHARAVITVSQGTRDILLESFRVSEVAVIPNGVGDRFFRDLGARQEYRDLLGLNPETPLIITVARLDPIKGYNELAAALRRLPFYLFGEVKPFFLWLGEGSDRAALEASLNAEVDYDVCLQGNSHEVAQWLEAADLFVLPTQMEGMPLAIIEAMAKGIPVITTNANGVQELIGDMAYARLDLPVDPEELAKTISQAIADLMEGEMDDTVRLGKALAENHTQEKMCAAYAHQIDRALNWGEAEGVAAELAPEENTEADALPFSYDWNNGLPEAPDHSLAFPFLIEKHPREMTWEYFRRDVPHIVRVDSRYPDVGFLSHDETRLLYALAGQAGANATALEIGCFLGWSTLYLSDRIPYLTVVDPLLNHLDWNEEVKTRLSESDDLRGQRMQSKWRQLIPDASDRFFAHLKGWPNKNYDFFFIDGDHEGEQPVRDAENAHRFADKDAMIVMHDLACPTVRAGFRKLAELGWNTKLYWTQQIMGVAWRGRFTEDPIDHNPDPRALPVALREDDRYVVQAPVVLIAYNRPECTARCLEALAQVKVQSLFVIMDGPKDLEDAFKVQATQRVIEDALEGELWGQTIVYRNLSVGNNLGLRARVTSGLDWVFGHCDRAIIVEDDVLTTIGFFQFCDQMLKEYASNRLIWQVSGSNFYPQNYRLGANAYGLSGFPHIWGWATWGDRWRSMQDEPPYQQNFDLEQALQKIQNEGNHLFNPSYWAAVMAVDRGYQTTWDYEWMLTMWCNYAMSITPGENLTRNIGFDQGVRATHPPKSEWYDLFVARNPAWSEPLDMAQLKCDRPFMPLEDHYLQEKLYEGRIVPIEAGEPIPIVQEVIAADRMIEAFQELAQGQPRTADEQYQLCRALVRGVLYVAENEGNYSTEDLGRIVTNLNLIPLYFREDMERDYMAAIVARAYLIESLLRRSGSTLEHEFPEKEPTEKIRIGFLYQEINGQRTEVAAIAPLTWLNRAFFDVFHITPVRQTEALEGIDISEENNELVLLEGAIVAGEVQQIRELNLDILVVVNNITAVTNWPAVIAAHRVARYQMVTHNSPVTTGFTNVDYYLTSDGVQPQHWTEAQEWYTEKLMSLGNVPHQYFNWSPLANQERANIDRSVLQIPQDAVVFVSGANFYKITPQVIEVWREICDLMGKDAYLALYPFNPHWSDEYPIVDFANQISSRISGNVRIVEPMKSRLDVLGLLQHCDVYLDSFPYAGVTSLLDPMMINLPIVTLSGQTPRSRTAASWMRLQERGYEVATTEEEYVTLACNWGTEARRVGVGAAHAERYPVIPQGVEPSWSWANPGRDRYVKAFVELLQRIMGR